MKNNKLKKLKKVFKKASRKVWEELKPIKYKNANSNISTIREEGLTSISLNEILRSKHSKNIIIKTISAKEEAIKGYDFEIAIGSESKGEYVRFYIQAKKLYGNSVDSKYNSFKSEQCDKLINHAKTKKSFPLYCCYNHIKKNNLLYNYHNSNSKYKAPNLGITLTSAFAFKDCAFKDFHSLHFNFYKRNEIIDFNFFRDIIYIYKNNHASAIPFHDILDFNIEEAKKINQEYIKYKKKQNLNNLSFFFFFHPGIFDFWDNEELIPILRDYSSEKLISDFDNSKNSDTNEENYNPNHLFIINTDLFE